MSTLGAGGGDEAKVVARDARGERYFVKLGGRTRGATTKAVAALGLAPPVVAEGVLPQPDGRAVVVQPFVAGHTASTEWLAAHQEEVAAMLARLAAAPSLRALLAPRGSGGPRVRALHRQDELDAWFDGVRASGWPGLARIDRVLGRLRRLAEALPRDGPPPVPVHADPQPGNWLVAKDGRPYLLDWETARLDDPTTDPARVAWWCLPPVEHPAFLRRCGLDPADEETAHRAHWLTTQYVAGIALWVVQRGRPRRGDHFLHEAEQLLDRGAMLLPP